MILNPQKKDELCEETFTKPNIGLSLRLLCNLHSIDPSTIFSKRLSIDTTLLESVFKLTYNRRQNELSHFAQSGLFYVL